VHLVPSRAIQNFLLLLWLAFGIEARAQELQWPIHSPTPPAIVQGFSEFGDVSKTKYHTGVDLGVPSGTAVYPVADGDVVLIQLLSAASDHGFGRTVVMRHGGTGQTAIYSQYSHLSEIDAKLIEACKPTRDASEVALACLAGVTRTTADSLGKSGGSGSGIENKWPAHLHIEIKSFGALCTSEVAGTVCGYSTAQPSSIGYLDPIEHLFLARRFPMPVPVVISAAGVAVRFDPDAGSEKRPITTLDSADTAVPLRGSAWASGYGACDENWIQVGRVDDPNCGAASGASTCFQDTRDPALKSPDRFLGLLPTAWICAKYLSPVKAATARQAVTDGILFSGGSVKVNPSGTQGLTIELVDRDGLFSVYEASRLGSDAVSDVWNLIFLDLVYAAPPYKTFAATHRDLEVALRARYGASCAGAQTPSAHAACAVSRVAKSRGIRMGGGRYDEGQRCVGWRDRPNGPAECRPY
jgi:hypothetical protein